MKVRLRTSVQNNNNENKMAAHIGTISPFVLEAENFTEWIERLEQYFIANDVNAAAKNMLYCCQT